ncbi:MAG TPA: winged helix-turn-helix domain-containing protein [Methylomirabilota bacterium]|nr:winged helix-turn-helix domain-containing protein [Methylomirabilota bacterium]
MKYRDRTEIITDMLRSASQVNGACKTRIMHEAFLSLPQLKEYFPLLLRNGLLEYDEVMKTYKITAKGSHVLELSVTLNQMLELSASLNHMIDPRITNRHKNTIKILI